MIHAGGCHCGAVRYAIDAPLATLDHPELCAPARHIWTRSRLPWLHLDEHLPGEPEETFSP